MEYLKASKGEPYRLPSDRNGRGCSPRSCPRRLLVFLVGQRINESYQNPFLPRSISIRRSLVEELAQFLRGLNKEVVIEYC